MIRAMLLALVCTVAAGQASAGGDQRSLTGLEGVRVEVTSFNPRAKKAGFDEVIFQEDIELRLRLAGIRLLSEGEVNSIPGMPRLHLTITPLHKSVMKTEPFCITLEMTQKATLTREPLYAIQARTWSAGTVGVGELDFMRQAARDIADQFVNEWLSVNPKK